MRQFQRVNVMLALTVAVVLVIVLLAFDTTRGILWLLTAAICHPLGFRGHMAYFVIFCLQIAVIGQSAFCNCLWMLTLFLPRRTRFD